MKPQHLYLILCFLGTAIPYAVFSPWLILHGPDLSLLLQQISTHPASAFAWLDVVFSALGLFAWIYYERKSRKVPHTWLAIVGTLTVGVSLGLPLYLYLREISSEKKHS